MTILGNFNEGSHQESAFKEAKNSYLAGRTGIDALGRDVTVHASSQFANIHTQLNKNFSAEFMKNENSLQGLIESIENLTSNAIQAEDTENTKIAEDDLKEINEICTKLLNKKEMLQDTDTIRVNQLQKVVRRQLEFLQKSESGSSPQKAHTNVESGEAFKIQTVAQERIPKPLSLPPIEETDLSNFDSLDNAIGTFTDVTLAPTYKGEELLAIENVPKILALFKENPFAKDDFKAFLFLFNDWKEIALERVKAETKLLIDQIETDPPNKNGLIRLLYALYHQEGEIQEVLEEAINSISTEAMPDNEYPDFDLDTLAEALEETRVSIKNEQQDLSGFLKYLFPHPESPPLEYGVPQWREMMMIHRPLELIPEASFLRTLFSPENWDESTKRNAYIILEVLKLGDDMIKTGQKYHQAADGIEKAAAEIKKVPPVPRPDPKEVSKIEDERAQIGIFLGQRYDKTEKLISQDKRFVNKFPDVAKALKNALELFGDTPPTEQQVKQFQDAYLADKVAQLPLFGAIESPFKHMSFNEWWTHFTTSTESPKDTNLSSHDNAPNFDSKKAVPWTSSLLNKLTSLVFGEQEIENPALYPQSKPEGGILKSSNENVENGQVSTPTSQGPQVASALNGGSKTNNLQNTIGSKSTFFSVAPARPQSIPSLPSQTPEAAAFFSVMNGAVLGADKKLLLHIIGDSFGGGTQLEGNHPINVLYYFKEVIEKYLAGDEKTPLPEKVRKELLHIKDQSDDAIRTSKAFYHSKLTSFHNAHQHVCGKIDNLPIGDSFYLPGGWSSRQSGHAIYYEILRDGPDKYRFRVFNSGSGIENHVSALVNVEHRYQLMIEIGDISSENLKNPSVSKILWEMQKSPEVGELEWTAKPIYNQLIKTLDGKQNVIPLTEKKLKKPQESGTCSFFGFQTTLDTAFGERLPNTTTGIVLLRATELRGIKDLIFSYGNDLTNDKEALRLVKKSIVEFSLNVKKSHDEHAIDDDVFVLASKEAEQLNQFVNELEEKSLIKAIEQTPGAKFAIINTKTPMSSEQQKVFPWCEISETSSLPYAPSYNIDVSTWRPTPSTLATDLKFFSETLYHFAQNKDAPGAVQGFIDIMLRAPLDQDWNSDLNLQNDQAMNQDFEKGIKAIKSMMDTVKESLNEACKTDVGYCDRLLPRYHVALLKASTLSYKMLISMYPVLSKSENALFFMPASAVKNIKDASDAKYMHTFDPEADKQICDLQDFWSSIQFLKYASPPALSEMICEKQDEVLVKNASLPKAVEKLVLSFLDSNAMDQMEKLLPSKPPILGFADFPDDVKALCVLTEKCNGQQVPPLLPESIRDYLDILRTYDSHIKMEKSTEKLQSPNDVWKSEYIEIESQQYKMVLLGRKGPKLPIVHHKDTIQNGHIASKYDEINWESILKRTRYTGIRLVGEKPPFFTQEMNQQLERIINNREVQITELLNFFFYAHPSSLSNREFRQLLKFLLFTPGVLMRDLMQRDTRDAQERIKVIKTLFHSQFHQARKIDDVEKKLFFLNMNDIFDTYLKHPAISHKVPSDIPTLNSRIEMKEMLKSPILSDEERSHLYQELAYSYTNTEDLKDEDVKDAMASAFHAKIFYPTENVLEDSKLIALSANIHKHAPKLQAMCENEGPNELLNHILSEFQSESTENKEWIPFPKFPLYATKDRTYQIDLVHLKIMHKEKTLAVFPLEIKNNRNIVSFFGKIPHIGVQLANNAFEIDHQGKKYQIVTHDTDVVVQTTFEIEGVTQKYQLVSQPEQIKRKNKNEEFSWLPPPIALTHNVWRTENKGHLLLTSADTNHPVYDVQFGSTIDIQKRGRDGYNTLVEGFEHVKNFYREGVIPKFISNLTPKKMLATYEDIVKLDNYADITKLDDQGARTTIKLAQLRNNRPEGNALFRFEDPKHVLVWAEAGAGKPQAIEIPRFGLSFHAITEGNKVRMESKEYEGFHIAKKQFFPGLEGVRNYLILENNNGNQKILIAQQELEKEHGSLNIEIASKEQELSNIEIKVQTYHAYDVITSPQIKASGQPQLSLQPASSTSEAGRFFLAKTLLWRMDYTEAEKVLRGHEFSRLYNEDEKKLLESIVSLKALSKDSDPRSKAISLYASYLLLKDYYNDPRPEWNPEISQNPKDTKKISDVLGDLPGLYGNYLNHINDQSTSLLKPTEELMVISHLNNTIGILLYRLALSNRLAQLDPEQARQFAKEKSLSLNVSNVPKTSNNPIPFASLEKDLTGPFSFYGYFDPGELAEYSISKHSILRPKPEHIFVDAYKLIKDASPQEAPILFKRITGMEMPKKNWKEELAKVIDIMIISQGDDASQPLQVLRALLHKPDEFPPSKEFLFFNTVVKGLLRARGGLEEEALKGIFPIILTHIFCLKPKKCMSRCLPSRHLLLSCLHRSFLASLLLRLA